MKYELKKSSISQPLGTFEQMYTDQGQLILKGFFFENNYQHQYFDPEVDNDDNYHNWKIDLEKEPIIQRHQISEDDYEEREIYYIKFLQGYIKSVFKQSIVFFELRLDSCNGLEEQYFVLYSFIRKIKKFKEYVAISALVPYRDKQLKWINNIESRLLLHYEKQTGFVSFVNQKLNPKDIKSIVGLLISDLNFSTDPGDLDKIVYFICSKNMTEYFGNINFGCSIWILKEIVANFQTFGFLNFTNVDILKTEFFRKKDVPLNIDTWNSSNCTSQKNKLEVMPKLLTAFKKTKIV